MSENNWGAIGFFWVDGDPPLARWGFDENSQTLFPPPQVQDIPGAFLNDLERLSISTSGSWYVTQDGLVYHAPLDTGVFREVAQVTKPLEREFLFLAYPEGLIVCQQGLRRISIISPESGLLSAQELPPLPIGVEQFSQLADVIYVPRPGQAGLVGAVFSREANSDIGLCFTTLFVPGETAGMLPDILTAEIGWPDLPSGWAASIVSTAVLADLYDLDEVFTRRGVSTRNGVGRYYDTQTPGEGGPWLSINEYGTSLESSEETTWGVDNAPALRLQVSWPLRNRVTPDARFPLPTAVFYELAAHITPMMADMSSASISVDGVLYDMGIAHDSFRNRTALYIELRGDKLLFQVGESYDLVTRIKPGTNPVQERAITMVAGGTVDMSGYIFDPEYPEGTLSRTDVATVGGVTYNLTQVSSRDNGIMWGSDIALGLIAAPPIAPPFWTSFVRTVELSGEGVIPPGPPPQTRCAEFTLTVGVDGSYVGYIEGYMGSVSPEYVDFGDGVVGRVVECVYNAGELGLSVVVQDVFGATGGGISVGEGESAYLTVPKGIDMGGAFLVRGVSSSPFVGGDIVPVRLCLDGDIWSTVEPDPDPDPDPAGAYVDFEVFAESDSTGVGFISGAVGGISPLQPVVGGVTAQIHALAYFEGMAALVVDMEGLFGATAVTVVIGGESYPLDLDPDAAAEYGVAGFHPMAVSPFVAGESYIVRVYIEGDLSPAPAPGPDGSYVDFTGVARSDTDAYDQGQDPAGSISPLSPWFGDVQATVYAVYFSSADGGILIELDDIFGATSALFVMDGIELDASNVTDSEYGLIILIPADVSPFVEGQPFAFRLYLEGDLGSDPGPDPVGERVQ